MKEKLTILYRTLCLIETKGASTKTMGDCLKYLEQMITELENQPNAQEGKQIEDKEDLSR